MEASNAAMEQTSTAGQEVPRSPASLPLKPRDSSALLEHSLSSDADGFAVGGGRTVVTGGASKRKHRELIKLAVGFAQVVACLYVGGFVLHELEVGAQHEQHARYTEVMERPEMTLREELGGASATNT